MKTTTDFLAPHGRHEMTEKLFPKCTKLGARIPFSTGKTFCLFFAVLSFFRRIFLKAKKRDLVSVVFTVHYRERKKKEKYIQKHTEKIT